MPARLKSGAMSARGGARKGAGRKPEWFRHQCRTFLEKRKLIKFVADVADGKDFEQAINKDGETVQFPASPRDRLAAVEFLAKHGFAEETGKIIGQFVEMLLEIITQEVPLNCPGCKARLEARASIARRLQDVEVIDIQQVGG